MRPFAVLALLALFATGAGCGDSKKGDNSHIQTPNDQPIGTPQPLGGGKPGMSTPAPGLTAPAPSGKKVKDIKPGAAELAP